MTVRVETSCPVWSVMHSRLGPGGTMDDDRAASPTAPRVVTLGDAVQIQYTSDSSGPRTESLQSSLHTERRENRHA